MTLARETGSFTIDHAIESGRATRGRRSGAASLREVPAPTPVEPGRLPRITRLMALAIRMRRLVDEGVVRDYSELARLGGVSIPRMTQIMRLVLLAPDIQEEILYLPRVVDGRDPIRERAIRAISGEPSWSAQRRTWRRCCGCGPLLPDAPQRRGSSRSSSQRLSSDHGPTPHAFSP